MRRDYTMHLCVERKVGSSWCVVNETPPFLFYKGQNLGLFALLRNLGTRNAQSAATFITGSLDIRTKLANLHVSDIFWLTLQDLDNLFPWDGSEVVKEWVGLRGWLEYKATGKPMDHTPKVSVRTHDELTNDEMDMYLHKAREFQPVDYVTAVEWDAPFKDQYPYFVGSTLPMLRSVDSDPNFVRIVYWFDK